jgi:hypothetical protein
MAHFQLTLSHTETIGVERMFPSLTNLQGLARKIVVQPV